MISVKCEPDRFLKTPIGYHYANHPAKSVDRIREVVFDNFNISTWSSIIFVITFQLMLLASRWWIAWERRSSCYGFSAFISYLGTLSRLEWRKHTRHTSLTYFLVPSTTQLLILSPFTPKYTIHNSFLNISTTVTTINYDSKSIQRNIPAGTPAYVQNVTINGVPASSRCHVDFYDAFRLGGDIVITLTADKTEADSCLGALPDSLSTGGFAQVR